MKGIFHIHTMYSRDSLLRPARVAEYARKNNIGVLAVTDHGTLAGAREVMAHNRDGGLQVIAGCEFSTERGDIIGLFLDREIQAKSSMEVIAAVKEQGGLVMLPHPARMESLDGDLLQQVDLVETYNCRVSSAGNRFAAELARAYDKPVLVGNDAHFAGELKYGLVEFHDRFNDLRKTLLKARRTFYARPSPACYLLLSRLVYRLRGGKS